MSVPKLVATNRALVLTAMIFAVAMTFIDQTIVSVAAPSIQSELGLSNTGVQWAINSYLLALARCLRSVAASQIRSGIVAWW